MRSLSSNSYQLHAQTTLFSTNSDNLKKYILASKGEPVSLLIAIDSIVRSNKINNKKQNLNNQLLESTSNKILPVSVLFDNKNKLKNINNNDQWVLDQLLKNDQVKYFNKKKIIVRI